ncbi:MAG: PQQ-binding-like beta-propeller repeat protein, partial [Planctomycetes bacterium]|nr:PQQ-binding-like beta-propeller repeat protein [Planctomycetota bacterium]
MNRPILALIAVAMFAVATRAADWPQHRADAARSGYTPERLPDGLLPRWTYRAAHRPMPAWPSRNRLRFDRAFQPVIAAGSLYFGSSADGKLYALDAATGERRWTFQSDGPLRFAPAVWRDRVLLA